MKLCERCGEVPVASVHSRYCETCRELAKADARARAKEMQPIRDAKYRAKKRAQKLAESMGNQPPVKTHNGCPGCSYWRLFHAGMKACHYTIDTGKVRPMPAAECYGHEGTPYKPKVQL